MKEFTFIGKNMEDLLKMDIKEFTKLLPARQRRTLSRGVSEIQQDFLNKVKALKQGTRKKPVKTHLRDMIILPEMVGVIIHIHRGKEFVPVMINEKMLGHYLGEFGLTRKRVEHSAPGIGATKSSGAVSVK